MNEKDDKMKQMVQEVSLKTTQDYLKSSAFTDRKLTDTPTDAYSMVNRKFVTLNGTTANRPTSSLLAQRYFDTDLNKPVWYGNSGWVDATGTPV